MEVEGAQADAEFVRYTVNEPEARAFRHLLENQKDARCEIAAARSVTIGGTT